MNNRNKDGTILVPAGDKAPTLQDKPHTYMPQTNTYVLTSIVKQMNACVKEQFVPPSATRSLCICCVSYAFRVYSLTVTPLLEHSPCFPVTDIISLRFMHTHLRRGATHRKEHLMSAEADKEEMYFDEA
jgi:hypothetical protein